MNAPLNAADVIKKFTASITPFFSDGKIQYGLIDVELSRSLPEICFTSNTDLSHKHYYELRNVFDAARPAVRFDSKPSIMDFMQAMLSLVQINSKGMLIDSEQLRSALVSRISEQLNTLSFTLRKLRLTPFDAADETYAQLDSDLYTLACSNYCISRYIEGDDKSTAASLISVRPTQPDYSQASNDELASAYKKHLDELFAIMQGQYGYRFKYRHAAFTYIRNCITSLETIILYEKMNAQEVA